MSPLSDLRQHFKGASSTQEKRLVLKLDFFILTFCCLAYFMNYLDRASITQAYVSGMKEDLGFEGAQLTEVTTLYATAYLIGIVPNNLLLTYFKPKRFFPFMITTWAIITMLNAVAKTPQHMMVIRFFQGYRLLSKCYCGITC
ncbi:pantothenate transporter liz1 [Colletotrichum tofieldiae]|nr:pantothenate transporter liz1 [Colletotrichum tofieldiae]